MNPEVETPDVLAEGCLTVEQAIEFSGLPRTNLYEAMNRGELSWTKVGRRRLIPRVALKEFMRRGLKAPAVA